MTPQGGAGRLSIADRRTPCRCSPRLPMPVRWLWLMPNEEPGRSRFPTPSYTSVQTLEFRSKSPISSHFRGPSACLPHGSSHSVKHCSITRSDIVCSRPGHPETAWDKEPSKWDYRVRRLFTIPIPTRYHGSSAVTLPSWSVGDPAGKGSQQSSSGTRIYRQHGDDAA
jgi:hypothetical protein